MIDAHEDSKLEIANHERALLYYNLYKELKKRFGKKEAIVILRNSLFELGREFGKSLKQFSPNSFDALYKAFAFAPDGGKMFSPKKIKCNKDGLEVKFMSCPLKKTWENLGLSNEDLSILLNCATALDEGTMAEAGFHLDIQTWMPGEEGCCRLKITELK